MNSKWIPVYQRLPENDNLVLVTCQFETDEGTYMTSITVASYFDGQKFPEAGPYWSDEQGENIEVLAWMELPEKYEEEPE